MVVLINDHYGTSTSNFPGQIQLPIIGTSYKSILTCLYNDEKNPKDYLRKILPVSAPSLSPRGAEFMESRVSAVSHPHRSTSMRELQCAVVAISLYYYDRRNSSKFYLDECLGWPHTSYGAVFEAKSITSFPVGAFLLLSRGIASFWCQVCFGPLLL